MSESRMESRRAVILLLFRLLLAGALMIPLVSSTNHIVGKGKGWNPGINYTNWVNGERFIVGDTISFRYKKEMYDVMEVNETAYEHCYSDNPIGNWTHGRDFIELKEPKRYYFICSRGYCYGGMKLSLVVEQFIPPTPQPVSDNSGSSPDSGGSVIFLAMVAAFLAWGVTWV